MKSRLSGPIEESEWPEKLKARVVSPDRPARIHGYEIDSDLSRHYRFTDVILLALTGELPEEAIGRTFEVALHFLAPVTVAEAPSHAAVLTRLSGARSSGVLATGVVGLTEQARWLTAEHAELLAWLRRPVAAPPARYTGEDPAELESLRSLRAAIAQAGGPEVPLLESKPGLTAAVIAVLYACGLKRAEHMEVAIVVARLPCVAAEAFAWRRTAFRDYPMDLPAIRYQEDT